MHQEQRDRAAAQLRSNDIHQALFASPASITWLTGFAPPPQLGPSPFTGGPPLVWYADGTWTLVAVDGSGDTAAGYTLVTYEGYTIERPPVRTAGLVEALSKLLHGTSNSVGIEYDWLPATLLRAVQASVAGSATFASIDGALVPLRMRKTAEELALLRQSFDLTGVGHAAARQAVRAGQREIDVWTAVHGAIQRAAGRRVALGNDCVSSSRVNNIGGWPGDSVLNEGDSCMVDLSVILDGYWSDSCCTYYVGEPSPRQRAMHTTAAAALEYAIGLIRPGAISGEVDRQVRAFMAQAGYPVYPHHTGHSVGVTGHEEPRIVPYNDIPFEEGMVLLLEPGIYYPGEAAVRLEDAVLVTADGCELLTHHDKGLGAYADH